MKHKEQVVCPYCQVSIRIGEESIECSDCKMPHHRECWIESGSCTTYGCKGRMKPKPLSRGHRRQNLPPIEISFDEVQENRIKFFFVQYSWILILILVVLLGFGYYWYQRHL